jgi:hypothetical protein
MDSFSFRHIPPAGLQIPAALQRAFTAKEESLAPFLQFLRRTQRQIVPILVCPPEDGIYEVIWDPRWILAIWELNKLGHQKWFRYVPVQIATPDLLGPDGQIPLMLSLGSIPPIDPKVARWMMGSLRTAPAAVVAGR